MKLVASVMMRNEMGRYLTRTLPALLEFCDEVCVFDDASTDGSYDYARKLDQRVRVTRAPRPMFEENEGIARQQLLEWTLRAEPSHVLAIDCDEFISDGARLRERVESETEVIVWSLLVCEVWRLEPDRVWIRVDGGWLPSFAPILYSVPKELDHEFRIPPRQLASGREPFAVVAAHVRGWSVAMSGVDLLHLGYADEATRVERQRRYLERDGGAFHSREHIDSITQVNGLKLEAMVRPAVLAGVS